MLWAATADATGTTPMTHDPVSPFAAPLGQTGPLSRRSLLKVGGLGLLGLTLPRLLQAQTEQPWVKAADKPKAIVPRARSVVFLYQFGAPSHVDMFDMKPHAPDAIRGPYKPIASSAD